MNGYIYMSELEDGSVKRLNRTWTDAVAEWDKLKDMKEYEKINYRLVYEKLRERGYLRSNLELTNYLRKLCYKYGPRTSWGSFEIFCWMPMEKKVDEDSLFYIHFKMGIGMGFKFDGEKLLYIVK